MAAIADTPTTHLSGRRAQRYQLEAKNAAMDAANLLDFYTTLMGRLERAAHDAYSLLPEFGERPDKFLERVDALMRNA